MLLKVLGSAAGGGVPQWNCSCPNCRSARAGNGIVRIRMNNSLAISADGETWYLINATPDVCAQIESHPELYAGPQLRSTPVCGILLTDAELDHTIGLLSLRQSSELAVYAAAPVLNALTGAFPVRQIIAPYATFHWAEIRPGESFPLFGERLSVYPFLLGRKPPRYAARADNSGPAAADDPWVVGYRFTDRLTGGVAVYAPGVESWTQELERQLQDADCILIDGTFWHADELRDLGASELDAAAMGHVPISGPNGSLRRLAELPARRKVYTHINNTNPILHPESSEHRLLSESGIEVGCDGLELEV
ncbi:pyrroloquinoline quinone biosynthesis protein PqqB [Paenibacillus thalictri]|uniref:Coenzyme PQQ synthesis protein B n=1 Tax=Paenibacillus thalictri TaxID=2527873 RepID=A0A4Q9DIS1_9BACL|nr:pyrroloquinoline quinone biosynthesis protein PqqB [Paenibacillus thalictri]TBL70714.1 pyrroloquinoline quinone biosynthesis protein PqqB [Paenibacillus thalictri]